MPSFTSGRVAIALAQARVARGMTVADLSEHSRVTEDKIQAIETGHLKGHVCETFAIARLLRVDLGPILSADTNDGLDDLRWHWTVLGKMFDSIRQSMRDEDTNACN